ncbi:MAG: hypothetical protein RL616_604 [Verrucomicrobiota bacterium]
MSFIPGFWRKCRLAFRWARYFLWFVVLLALLALAWVNVVGVPEFVKTRLVASLGEQGVQLEFSRMRWRFIRGLVAENVIIGDKLHREQKPLFTAGQIQLRLNYAALAHRQFQLTGVVVRDGIFTLPLSATDRLVAQNIQAEVRFLPDGTWSLDDLRADFSGAKIRLSGQLAHARDATKWDVFTGNKGDGHGALRKPLADFSATLAKIRFAAPPQISAEISGDARDAHSLVLKATANAPSVVTPWFNARRLQLVANLSLPTNAPADPNPALGFWTNARPFRLAWITRAAELELTNFSAREAECAGEWQAPRLAVGKLSAQTGNGQVSAAAALDVVTRELQFTNRSAFDLHLLEPFLPARARAEVAKIFWTQPPSLACEGALTLPAWTNAAFDWRELFGPTARLHGEFAATNAVAHGLTVELARTHFSYANFIWRAPDLQLIQGRTQLEFSGEQSLATENFSGTLRGTLALETTRPFLPTNVAAVVFKIIALPEPVALNLAADGNWRDLNSLTATGRVALTNFAVRGQPYDSVTAQLFYTNRSLIFLQPQMFRAGGSQTMTADAVALDWRAGMIFFTNGFSIVDPTPVLRSIGEKTARLIAPYEFLTPPTARAHGQLPLRDINRGRDLDGTDLTFEILKADHFRWTKLSTTNITGTVHWLGQELVLTNIVAETYGGNGAGWAYFDFHPVGYGCDFKFGVAVTNLDVHELGLDLSDSKTNLIAGSLTGAAVVTDGNTKTWRSWNGFGGVQLRDGQLWNIPLFGLLSPVLNTVTPGLGNNRATEATGTFVLTNGVARSVDAEIHTLTMRLQYVGTVDLQESVDARVTAQLLRNTPMLGEVVSTLLWPVSKIFECQVNGKVSAPQVTPIYFPGVKYLLNPVRTLEEILPATAKPKG